MPSAGETVCRKALDAPERRDHPLLNTVHLAVMESRCDQLNWDHSAPACDERDTFLSGIGQASGRYSLRPAWWPQRWRSYDDLFGRWRLASPSRRSSTRPQRGPAGCRRADTRTVARDHEGAAHQHLRVGPCAGRTLRGRAQLAGATGLAGPQRQGHLVTTGDRMALWWRGPGIAPELPPPRPHREPMCPAVTLPGANALRLNDWQTSSMQGRRPPGSP